jgi:hypothetical protein
LRVPWFDLAKVSAVEKITEELTADIDSALAEVVSGLQMLEMQQLSDKRMSLPNVKQKASAKHTPDLVLDLPEGSNSSQFFSYFFLRCYNFLHSTDFFR